MTSLVGRHMRRRGGTISAGLRLIMHRNTGAGVGVGCMRIVWLGVWCGRVVLRPRVWTSSVIFAMAVVTTGRLWTVRNYLHTPRYSTGRAAASRGVCRGSWTSEPFV
jgi:hypothetical protein